MIQKYTKLPIQSILIDGINYAYLTKGEGPLICCVHGFPDNAITYEETIHFFAAQGYQVIAPFLRGYYPSDCSPDNDYSVYSVAQDMLKIVTALGKDKFFLIGHDWGASISYCMANLAPERVQKLITLAVPHSRQIKPSLKLFWRARHFILFQFKRYGAWYTRRNNYQYLDFIYQYWSPNWDIPTAHWQMMKESFQQPGYLEAALGYYQWIPKDQKDDVKQKIYRKKTTVPSLLFGGDTDGAINFEDYPNMKTAFTNGFEFQLIKGAGHFLHQEAPDVFHQKVLNFIK